MDMKEIKNFIIKKLGGYTPEEYQCLNGVHYEFLPRPISSNVRTLCASATYSLVNSVPQDWIEDKLIMILAKQIKPYVRFENEYEEIVRKTVHAYVKVVDDNDGNF